MFLDTSVITEIFVDGRKHHKALDGILNIIENETEGEDDLNYVSIVQLAEVADWCARNRVPAKEGIENVKKLAQIIPLDEDICEASGSIKYSRRQAGTNDFGLIDAIILASARAMNQRLLTLDKHFEGQSDCTVLKPKRDAQ